jgi:serine/threonine protein kinase
MKLTIGVVKLLNVFENGEIVCVVMEKMNGGDLLEYVLTRPDKTISERQSKHYYSPLSPFFLSLSFISGLGNVRPAGQIRPAKHLNVVRQLHLKFSN